MPLADVFVSYERRDADRARKIVELLRVDKLDVWWDHGIHTGSQWRQDIEANLAQARVVICLWSKTSIASTFVLDEARRAGERGILCPVLLDAVDIPLGFGETQAANLIGWSGAQSDPAWRYLVDSVRARLVGERPPERRPPKPRASLVRPVLSALGAIAALLTIVVTSEQLGWTDLIIGFPATGNVALQPASAAELSAWHSASARTDRCEAMREFLRSHPDGRYAAQAQTILASKTDRPGQRWSAVSMPSLVTGTSNLEERASEVRACQSAQASAQRNAQSGCDIYASDPANFRNMQLALGTLSCECRDHAIRLQPTDQVDPIWRCNVRANYQCRGEAAETATTEYCGEPSPGDAQ